MLPRVATALHARVRGIIEPLPDPSTATVREKPAAYKTTRRRPSR